MTNFTINEGKNKTLKLTYKDSAGNIINITGASARMMARKGAYGTPVFDVNAVITGAAGEITFLFVPVDTAGILTDTRQEVYDYDVELTLVSGEKFPILDGEVTIKQPITRD